MSNNWTPPGSSGTGPPAGENNEPSMLRGVTPGQRGQESGFENSASSIRENITQVGKLNAALSNFYSKLGGDGKRKVTEFSTLIKGLNTELAETEKRLKAVAEQSGKVGGAGGGGRPGDFLTPGGSVHGASYTQSQLPKGVPGTYETVSLGGGGAEPPSAATPAPNGGRGAGGGISLRQVGAVAAGVGYAAGSWFNRMAEPVALQDLEERRRAMIGPSAAQTRATMQGQLGARNFSSGAEYFGTQQTLEQQGLALGGESMEGITQSAGAMRQFMPGYSTEQIAGAGAAVRHGQAGRNLRMKGIIDWDMPTEEVFRQILKAGTRDKQLPSAELLQTANPGSAYYEVLMVLTGGDAELVRMVLEWGRAEVASKLATGQQIDTKDARAHATKMGLGENTVEDAARSRQAQDAQKLLNRQDMAADEFVDMHGRAEALNRVMTSLEESFSPLVGLAIELGGKMSSFSSLLGTASGGMGGQIMNAATNYFAVRAGVGGAKKLFGRGAAGKVAQSAAGKVAQSGVGRAASRVATGAAAQGAKRVGARFIPGAGWVMAGMDVVNLARSSSRSELEHREGRREEFFAENPDATEEEWEEENRRWHGQEGLAGLGGVSVPGTEPAGGPPLTGVDSIHGADHTGAGYSKKGFGGVKSHVAQAGHYIEKMFGKMPGGIGGVGQRANASDHPKGLALDFMTMKNKALGERVSNFLVKNAKHFGVKYVIFRRRINSIDGRGWRRMEDRGSDTANHEDHPHVSFTDAPGSGAGGVTDADLGEEQLADTFTGSVPGRSGGGGSATASTEEADFLASIFGGTGGAGGGQGAPGSGVGGGGGGAAAVSASRGEQLSDEKLMAVLRAAGFSGQGLVTAFAVAKAESGGNAGAHNPNASTGDNSYGLFQINMLGGLGPDRRKQFGLKTNEDLFDPIKNAEIAYQMSSRGTRWSHWSVHPSSKGRGAKGSGYEQHLDTAKQLAGGGGGVEPRGGLSTVGSLGEGTPSGGTSMGNVGSGVATPRAGAARQVNVKMIVQLEKATRREAEDLVKMVRDIAVKETALEEVGDR